MAGRVGSDYKGPRFGDAASLWNFAPSPGWTKAEAHILKLCLMKLGVGKWTQILDTGLLQGKLIQQLNGQTQRLLGQQSLAAFTGLQVDVDRIRADNERRTDVQRKGGLIINMGDNLTKKQKEGLQSEAKKKYGLTSAQVAEAGRELEQLAAAASTRRAGAAPTDGAADVAGREPGARGASSSADLMTADVALLSREEKLALLERLHVTLVSLHAALLAAEAEAASMMPRRGRRGWARPPAALPIEGNQEGNGQAAGAAPGGLSKPAKRRSAAEARPERPAGGGGRGKRRAPAFAIPPDTEASEGEGGSGGEDAGMAEALGAAAAADVASLTAMGFGGRQARDALEEAGGDVEAAAEWLLANCV